MDWTQMKNVYKLCLPSLTVKVTPVGLEILTLIGEENVHVMDNP